ncbi:C-type lectin domain family 17, member A-like [Argopecten irradians]|uniref:C-type lectin domain family 17, member A-like n=1 Tax=Argopecten irradians TaxID=31199 RepID=UPI003717CF1F
MKDGNSVCLDQDVCPGTAWKPLFHKCYFFNETVQSADESIAFCGTMDAKLVRIDNASVQAFLQTEMINRGMNLVWIAANDRDVEGEWVWGPGDEVTEARWYDGEPNNTNNEDCCVIRKADGLWLDLKCETTKFNQRAVCQRQYKLLL